LLPVAPVNSLESGTRPLAGRLDLCVNGIQLVLQTGKVRARRRMNLDLYSRQASWLLISHGPNATLSRTRLYFLNMSR